MLKLLQGNPGKRPIRHEPKPRLEMPRCPSHLDAEARREWRRVAPELHALGLLTAIDGDALAVYCTAWSQWVEAEKHLEEDGLVISVNGVERPSPWLRIANQAQRLVLDMAREFGMTPISRGRITVIAPPAAADPFDDLLRS